MGGNYEQLSSLSIPGVLTFTDSESLLNKVVAKLIGGSICKGRIGVVGRGERRPLE